MLFSFPVQDRNEERRTKRDYVGQSAGNTLPGTGYLPELNIIRCST